MTRFHSTYATGARPIGAPGCPELAFCTASIASVRIVLIAVTSSAVNSAMMLPRVKWGSRMRIRDGRRVVNHQSVSENDEGGTLVPPYGVRSSVLSDFVAGVCDPGTACERKHRPL